MTPASIDHVRFPGWHHFKLAEHQDEYNTLPIIKNPEGAGHVISCWRLSWRERFALLFGGRIYLTQLAFGWAPMPVHLSTKPEIVELP